MMDAADPAASGAEPGVVTVSVVSHGQGELLAGLLADLQALAPTTVKRLIVTLNLDEPLPPLPPWPQGTIEVIRNLRPLGFGANHNQAFRRCRTEWFAVLNPDLRLAIDVFAPLVAEAAPGDALLSPAIVESDGAPADSARQLLTPWQLARRALGHRQPAQPANTDWLAGMFLLLRREAFAAVGGFDERFHMYCEDADLCLRLQLAGWRIRVVEHVAVVHAAQRASRRSWQHLRWHLTSLLRHWFSLAFWRYVFARGGVGGIAPMADAGAARSPDQKAP